MTQTNNRVIYWSQYMSEIGEFHIATTVNGLCFIGSPNKSIQELKNRAKQRFLKYELVKDDKKLQPYIQQLDEYFRGKRRTFTMPVDVEGTSFQKEVWRALKEIPYGETCTYSQIANMINKPTAARAVGAAIGKNPILVSVPCHRIVGKGGSLTGYRGGLKMKKQLLHLEKANGNATNG